jgi:hypothetical protein
MIQAVRTTSSLQSFDSQRRKDESTVQAEVYHAEQTKLTLNSKDFQGEDGVHTSLRL